MHLGHGISKLVFDVCQLFLQLRREGGLLLARLKFTGKPLDFPALDCTLVLCVRPCEIHAVLEPSGPTGTTRREQHNFDREPVQKLAQKRICTHTHTVTHW